MRRGVSNNAVSEYINSLSGFLLFVLKNTEGALLSKSIDLKLTLSGTDIATRFKHGAPDKRRSTQFRGSGA
jgi:hypothetical protein